METEHEKTQEMAAPRICANCACSFIKESSLTKLESQMFCRKLPPVAANMRGEKPRMRDGHAVIDRRSNKPEMESTMVVIYLYAPTEPELTCFDGWRPMGCLPGHRFVEEIRKVAIETPSPLE